jgi:purine nucleoside permease
MRRLVGPTAGMLLASALWAATLAAPGAKPIPVKVVVVAMFERSENKGGLAGEYQLWVEREHLDQIFDLPAAYRRLRMNSDGVLGLLTGVGTAKAAASVMALGLDPRFDLAKAYWVVAGIAGGDPADVSLGSAVWVEHVIDSDFAYEIDAREIPRDWPTGYVPLRRSRPYEPPARPEVDGQIFSLNPQLVSWAFELTRNVPLVDSRRIQRARARFRDTPNAQRPPFVTHGDALSGMTLWHGVLMDNWANAWVRYFTGGQGNFMVTAMEDTGTLQALTFLSHAGRVDLERVLVLRTVSNYDRQPPGVTAAESLKQMSEGDYDAYRESLEAAERVGDKVVRDLVAHWSEREAAIPSAQAGENR